MPVIEFVRYTDIKTGSVWIPNYHTGHLGFVPGTELSLSLRIEQDPEGCEVIATPFHRRIGSMFRLTVMLEDKPGVVNRLLTALSRLGLNIVKADSCLLNAYHHHFVELILDWAPSRQFNEFRKARTSDVHLYRALHERIPMTDYRYLRLYEAIMAYCGDDIVFDRSYGGGTATPAIHVRPYSNRREEHNEQGTVRKGSRRDGVSIDLSEVYRSKIRSHTGYDPTDPLPYVLNSQGESRTLRILFPTRQQARRIFPVAMIHRDKVGALAAFTHVLAELKYNILASLLRKHTEEQSTWEVLLEAPPSVQLPKEIQAETYTDPKRRNVEAAKWFAKELEDNGRQFRDLLRPYEVRIAAPLYPRVGDESIRIEFIGEPVVQDSIKKTPIGDLLATRFQALSDNPMGHRWNEHRKFLRDVARRVRRRKPKIFLSYSRSATIHAAYIRNHVELNSVFEIVDYQEADFAEIATKAIELIQECDFFIGIWHAEPASGGRHFQVSPWMPFEYGAALAAGKPSIVVHSANLPVSITRRIKAGIAHPEFKDESFGTKTVARITEFCMENWAWQDYMTDALDEDDRSTGEPTAGTSGASGSPSPNRPPTERQASPRTSDP